MADVDSSETVERIQLQDEGVSSARASMYNVLRALIKNNIEHFRAEQSTWNDRFLYASTQMELHLNDVEPLVESIRRFAYNYDLDVRTPGNGYRSFIHVVDSCVLQCIRLCRHICLKRSSFLFRTSHYCSEVEAYASTMCSLKLGLRHLHTLASWSEPGSLFPDEKHSLYDLLREAESIDQRCFYGRCLAFQFCESMRKPLVALSLMMASFSEVYYNSGGMLTRTATSLFNCGRYVLNPEERAERVVDISQRAGVDFCKSFWLLQETELMQHLPTLVCPPVQVNKVIIIDPVPMQLPAYEEDIMVDIPMPSSHVGSAPIQCRLISASYREGQYVQQLDVAEDKRPPSQVLPLSASPYLMIQCHGGGFVAQSSKSHETYLRDWAKQLNIPIFCIDYSLAPDAPYPRALEECVYAYSWALLNAYKLGSTADKVILVGDSAGGNLMIGLTMKTIDLRIRKPDAVLAIYTPVLIEFIPSPSRLLCLMDPLLPFGFMMRCLKAYVGSAAEEKKDNEKESVTPSDDTQPFSQEPLIGGKSMPYMSQEYEFNADSSEELANGKSDPIINKDKITHAVSAIETSLPRPSDLGDTFLNVDKAASSIEPSKSVTELTMEATRVLRNMSEDDPRRDRTDSMTTISLTPDEDYIVGPAEVAAEGGPDYLQKFLQNYSSMKEGEPPLINEETMQSEENVLFEMPRDLSANFTSKLSSMTSSMTNRVMTGFNSLFPRSPANQNAGFNKLEGSKPLNQLQHEFKKFSIDKDPYLSPYLASDEMLQQMPPMSFMALQLDPCLDDSIMFAKRLRKLGKEVHLQILDKLPHGFLNFAPISKDAHEGSKLCMEEVNKLLRLADDLPSPSDIPTYFS